MRQRTDAMARLAASRPAYFDDPGDLQRRRSDLEQAISAALPPGFSSAPVTRTGVLRRSRPFTIGLAAAATVAAVTSATTVIFNQKTGHSAAAAATAAHPTGRFLVDSSESHYLTPIKVNGEVLKLDEVSATQSWSPRSPQGRGITVETTRNVLADEHSRETWNRAGSPTKVPSATPGKGEDHLTFDLSVSLGAVPKTEVSTSNAVVRFDGCGDMDQCARFPADTEGVTRRFNALVDARFTGNRETQRDLEKDGSPDDGSPVAHVPDSTIRARATFDTARQVLNAPITASARRTIVHLLETGPGIRKIGPVKDQQGRTGTGFTQTSTSPDAVTESRLVIEAGTGRLLAEEERTLSTTNPLYTWLKPTDIVQSVVHLGLSWTDADPPKPKIKHYPDGTNDLNWPPR